MDEIVEMMARAYCLSGGFNPDDIASNGGPCWKYYVPGIRAAISALHAGGWRIVPVEPTEEMMAAGVMENDKYATEIAPCSAFRANDCYRAMLDASPVKKG